MPPERGEVWLADLGIAAKVRPVLVVSVPYGDKDNALLQVIPHTTQPRGAQFEIQIPVNSLEAGAFNVQGMLAVPALSFCAGSALSTGRGWPKLKPSPSDGLAWLLENRSIIIRLYPFLCP